MTIKLGNARDFLWALAEMYEKSGDAAAKRATMEAIAALNKLILADQARRKASDELQQAA